LPYENNKKIFFRSRRFSDREKVFTQAVRHIINRLVHSTKKISYNFVLKLMPLLYNEVMSLLYYVTSLATELVLLFELGREMRNKVVSMIE
jgi:hypothetical protein